VLLLSVFNPTTLEVTAASVRDRRDRPLTRDSESLTISPGERIEVTILGLTIMVVQGLLSFHHFDNLKHLTSAGPFETTIAKPGHHHADNGQRWHASVHIKMVKLPIVFKK